MNGDLNACPSLQVVADGMDNLILGGFAMGVISTLIILLVLVLLERWAAKKWA